MKLTVGSLPSAVYWRRRLLVLGGALAVLLLAWASCSGGDDKARKTSADGSSTSRLAATATSPAASPTSPAASPATSPPAATQPPADPGPSTPDATCADGEIQLTPVLEYPSAPPGREMRLTLKVKNTASRSCQRDLGADAQELYLTQGSGKVWSSDACDPLHGTRVVTLTPGEEQGFNVPWDGRATADGCGDRRALQVGEYQLVARLGSKTSSGVTLTIK